MYRFVNDISRTDELPRNEDDEYSNYKSPPTSSVQPEHKSSRRGKRPTTPRRKSHWRIACSVCLESLDFSVSCWFCATCFDNG